MDFLLTLKIIVLTIHILDYKPDASKVNAVNQLTIYALAGLHGQDLFLTILPILLLSSSLLDYLQQILLSSHQTQQFPAFFSQKKAYFAFSLTKPLTETNKHIYQVS
jgi:hypothetical protein